MKMVHERAWMAMVTVVEETVGLAVAMMIVIATMKTGKLHQLR